MNLGEVRERKVIRAHVNWFYTDEGEAWERITVGYNGVEKIDYHEPVGEGDKHFIDVFGKDGCVSRHFNINSVEFESCTHNLKGSSKGEE